MSSTQFWGYVLRGEITAREWLAILGGSIVIFEFFYSKLNPIGITDKALFHAADKIYFENGPVLGWLIATWRFAPERIGIFGIGTFLFLLGVRLVKMGKSSR